MYILSRRAQLIATSESAPGSGVMIGLNTSDLGDITQSYVNDSQGNHGYSSGEDSPQRHSSSNTYTRPSLPQDPQRSHSPTPIYGQSYSQASPSGRSADEAHLVNDMCTPGGLRAQPDREDLRLFVENAASLNGTTVAELLQAKMVRTCTPSVVTCGHARYPSRHMHMWCDAELHNLLGCGCALHDTHIG